MKEWFTNTELADLALPGFPNTPRGVLKWIEQRDLDARFPNKVRRRQGRGGGVERHFTVLPKPVQSILTLRQLKSAETPSIDLAPAQGHTVPEPLHDTKTELRRDAILLVLNFWDMFRAREAYPLETARHLFVHMYRNGKLEGMPEWAMAALPAAFCANTLRNWEKTRADGDFNALAGRYGNRRGTGVLDKAESGKVAEFIAARIVAQPMLTTDHLRDLVIDRFGYELDVDGETKPLPNIRSFQRWVSAWKEEHDETLLKLTNPDAFRNRTKIAGSNMNHWVSRPNQLWEVDASPADALLQDGRHSIYALVDIYPRRMMVTVTKTPRTAAVLSLIRAAILEWGVPEIIRTDNGSDFISHEFRRALSSLGIHQDITDPFSPEQKGTVERHIGTLQRGLMRLLPGFVGHNVADRKAIEARKSFAARLGESEANTFVVDLTKEDLQATVSKWIDVKYHHKPHSGLAGKTPFEVMAAWSGPIRRIEDERALDILLAPIAGKDGFRTVTRQGIALDRAHFIHPDMIPGTQVLCRQDPEDMGRLYVYAADAREFLYIAECPERLGVDPGEAVRAARAAQQDRIRNEAEPLMREIRSIKPRDMIDAVLNVGEEATANLTTFPQAAEAYTTPEIDAAAEAGRHYAGPVTPAAAPVSAQEEDHHDAIIADLAEFRSRLGAPEDDPEKARFRNALDLQEKVAAGEHVPQDRLKWLVGYQQSAEYRSLLAMFEDYGERLFIS